MNWWIFVCSCLLVAGLLLRLGAPPLSVAAGLVIGGFLVWRRRVSAGKAPR